MQILVTPDTTSLSYWLNWRVLLCAIWVLTPMVIAFCILWKYEGLDSLRSCSEKTQQETAHSLCGNKVWLPCLEQIHPVWLLAYRVISFCFLLTTLIVKISVSGFGTFFYYTQWTFTLVTIYFGVCVSMFLSKALVYIHNSKWNEELTALYALGSVFSIYGCYRYMGSTGSNVHHSGRDTEQVHLVPLTYVEGGRAKRLEQRKFFSNLPEGIYESQAAVLCSYLFQVIFQMTTGAVMLTDCVYWSIIFPFLTIRDYTLNFMTVNMHTVNAALLLGDTALNCLPFPWFRICYFIFWTGTFVIFQWTVHACILIWWPYPFLNLSSPYAPLWYLLMALMHIPCYGIFVLIVKIKHNLLSKWFPQSYSCLR